MFLYHAIADKLFTIQGIPKKDQWDWLLAFCRRTRPTVALTVIISANKSHFKEIYFMQRVSGPLFHLYLQN